MSTITQKIQKLREQIPDHVRLVAITKGVSVEAIAEAYEAGVRDFGESRLQEALPKQKQLAQDTDITILSTKNPYLTTTKKLKISVILSLTKL